VNVLEAIDDPRLLGSAFRDRGTWVSWRALLAAVFALPMSDDEIGLFRACTGRTSLPERPYAEIWLPCGRRAGKSFILALIAVYLAAFRDYAAFLARGERATIMVIAADRRQARVIMRYVKALLEIPALAALREAETAESVDLSNRVTIEVGTASYKSLRGYTLAAALCDEIAFWPQEDSAAPDVEILAALRPAMATIPGAMLLCASSPYARRGALWGTFRRYYGVDDPNVLVWRAPTRVMNPTVPERVIEEARERDPDAARGEYDAEFRDDISGFVDAATIEASIEGGVTVHAPLANICYCSFVDPSGGSSDSMTMAITHAEGERIVLDYIGERKAPFSPTSVVSEFAEVLKQYRVKSVSGDRYAGEWPREAFQKYGITYEPAEMNRSELYLGFLPLLNSGRVSLLDNKRMVAQFVGLERRTSRAGRDTVDHSPGSHDDVANSVAGAVCLLSTVERPMIISAEMLRLARQPPPGGRWADRAHRMRIRLRSALAIALAAAAIPAEATTATTRVPLSSTTYTDLGAGPIMLGANAGEVIYQVSDSQPAANSGGYAQLPGQPPTPIRTTSHIWAIGSIPGASASVAGGLITARIVSTIPMIFAPSATIGANGAVSGITPALPRASAEATERAVATLSQLIACADGAARGNLSFDPSAPGVLASNEIAAARQGLVARAQRHTAGAAFRLWRAALETDADAPLPPVAP